MAASSRKRGGIIADINITPLVDITLVLLVVFMVTAKVIVSQAIPLDLPAAAKSEQVQLVFGVELLADGRVIIDGAPVQDIGRLLPLAQKSAQAHEKLRAVIRAERDVRHGRVIEAMDMLKQAGITHIAFAVVPKQLDENAGE